VTELGNGLMGVSTATPWREWLKANFPRHTSAPFAPRHERYWNWLSSLQPGVKPRARVEVWPRGGGKSTTTEAGCAYLGSQPEPPRKFALYVCATQEQADTHLSSISTMLLSIGITPLRDVLGRQTAWRLQQIRANNGFSIVSMGLDSAIRGAKLDDQRPDLIIFDDIDARFDSEKTVAKKIQTITTSILPTGSTDCAVIFVQNKIHADSIVSQLCDDKVDFLRDREPATVEPAVIGLEWQQFIKDDGSPRYKITAGTATWAGQSLQTCESQLNDWGILAFLRESQHEVDEVEGGLWSKERDIAPFRVVAYPDLDRIVVGVDPNAGGADEAGIVIGGIARQVYDHSLRTFRLVDRWHAYVLDDMTTSGGAKQWAEAAVTAYNKWRADHMVAEANNGGDMVTHTIGTVDNAPPVELVWASRGKVTRAEPVQKLYADGRVHHVGTFHDLEKELCTWKVGMASPNRLDACVWALTELLIDGEGDFSELEAYQRNQGLR
jgi:hypothetical protein